MKKESAKQRMLKTLTKTSGYNTFSTAQARIRFGVKNVSARIAELRKEGYAIYTNIRNRGNGTKVAVYRLGKPSRSFKTRCRSMGIRPQAI
jgi:hypothetical protein